MLRVFIFTITLLSLYLNSFGQDPLKASQCNYQLEPCWIQMMEDPNVNYFEAQKAFSEFWKARGGEPFVSENLEERAKHDAEKKSTQDKKIDAGNQQYIIEYKKFKNWLEEVKPYVKEDGSIQSEEERKKIYEEERRNR